MKSTMRWVLAASLAIALIASFAHSSVGTAQTPVAASNGCNAVATPSTSDGHANHTMESTPAGHDGHDMSGHMKSEVPYDLFYIDMMIPHHESVIALAEVAQYELTHPTLLAMTDAIIASQGEEIAQLQEWRDAWYPDAEPVSMDAMMNMPGLESAMMGMEEQMSAEWQVQQFCAAADRDLAFIDQVIPHHAMAIAVSEPAAERSEHPELVAMAAAVIEAQQNEIDVLEQVRAELTNSATPEA